MLGMGSVTTRTMTKGLLIKPASDSIRSMRRGRCQKAPLCAARAVWVGATHETGQLPRETRASHDQPTHPVRFFPQRCDRAFD